MSDETQVPVGELCALARQCEDAQVFLTTRIPNKKQAKGSNILWRRSFARINECYISHLKESG